MKFYLSLLFGFIISLPIPSLLAVREEGKHAVTLAVIILNRTELHGSKRILTLFSNVNTSCQLSSMSVLLVTDQVFSR